MSGNGLIVRINAKFVLAQGTKNPQYSSIKFAAPEYFKGAVVPVSEPNLTFTLKTPDADKLVPSLKHGEVYSVESAIAPKDAKGDFKSGINYNLLKVTAAGGQQVYP